MGVLANHVPSIEQLKPGLVEIIEESGTTKQFFCTFLPSSCLLFIDLVLREFSTADFLELDLA